MGTPPNDGDVAKLFNESNPPPLQALCPHGKLESAHTMSCRHKLLKPQVASACLSVLRISWRSVPTVQQCPNQGIVVFLCWAKQQKAC